MKKEDYNNWWYAGGSYVNPTGWWNTYELRVTPSTGDPSKDIYYFNGSGGESDSGENCEAEFTLLVKYTASFKVMGGGSMLFRIHDHNCKANQNCGKDKYPIPCDPREVDMSGLLVQPPATSPAAPTNQPPSNQADKTYYPQWLWVVATSVTPA